MKIYKELFTSAFKINMFTVGGGYVIVPLMQKRFVEELKMIEAWSLLNFKKA